MPKRPIALVTAVVAMHCMSAASAALDLNQHGLSGSWYEPATGGQGLEIETFPDLVAPGTGFIFVSWFTFDYTTSGGADRQRWYTLSGYVASGATSAQLAIAQNVGGNFDAPPTTASVQVGTATLSFASCTQGTLDYMFSDGSGRSGSIPIARITPNVTCVTQGAAPSDADFALSGNWFAPEQAGQGFTVEINPPANFAFVAWYTYSPQGATQGVSGQRWYTLQSAFVPGTRSLPMTIAETTGGLFDTPTSPGPSIKAVGTATLTFQSCSAATLSFAFTGGSSAGAAGNIALSRVVPTPLPPGCSNGSASAAEGFWSGSIGSQTFRDTILDDGTFYLVYSTAGTATHVVQGSSHAENGTITSSDAMDFPIASKGETDQAGLAVTVNGSFVPKSSLQLTIRRQGATETLSGTYEALYAQPENLSALAGSYQGYSGHAGGRLATSFSLDARGNLSGSNVACGYAGTVAPRGSTNVFDLSVQSTAGQCIFGAGPVSGIMIYDTAARRISGFAPYDGRSDQYFLIGTK